MSCEESDSEEFYDAEDETPDRSSRRGSKRSIVLSTETSEGDDDNVDDDIVGDDDVNELERRLAELERRTQDIKHEDNDGLLEKERKLKEVQQIVNADATPVVSSPYITAERPRATGVASNAASFDDIKKKLDYGIGETDPRIIIEDFGSAATRTDSPVEGQGAVCTVTCAPEPDIVQSTKLSKSQPARLSPPISPPPEPGAAAPVAPPRHRKKIHPVVPKVPISINTSSSTPTPVRKPSSPTVSFDVALDLNVAASGSRVVESKDDLCDRAEKTEAELRPVLLDPDLVSHASQDTSDTLSQGSDVINTRPRSNSGRLLSDKEILDLVSVKNLDTGEGFVLSEADDKIPQCANPIDFQIMTRTKEHSSSEGSLPRDKDHQTKDDMEIVTTVQKSRRRKTVQKIRHKGAKFKRYLGKKVTKMKNAADEMLKIDETSSDDDLDARRPYKYKASRSQAGPYEFEFLKPCQELKGQNMGAAWVMKFSPCGQLLAVGGQDNILRIWVLKDAYTTFDNLRQQYAEVKVSPSPSSESLNSLDRDAVADSASIFSSQTTNTVDTQCAEAAASAGGTLDSDEQLVYKNSPFVKKPFCMYRGHTADLLDVSWSKNYFILSSSMDKTVRLWHISRKECLCCFQHIDFVTAIAFHPRDERYFLSGSLDGKLRLWNIPDKKVELWNEISGHSKLITAANFCMNGKLAVVGTYDGHCLFYHTEQLKFHTGSKVGSKGRKITGIEPHLTEDKMLVTSNDSRLYLYDLRDLTLVCKYKGGSNCSSQIKASFSSDGKYIICGSEDQFVRIWKTFNDLHMFSSGRRDRNKHWEGIRAHNTVVTAAIFAPNPNLIIKSKSSSTSDEPSEKRRTIDHLGEVVVSADFNGIIKVFKNRFRQKVPKQ